MTVKSETLNTDGSVSPSKLSVGPETHAAGVLSLKGINNKNVSRQSNYSSIIKSSNRSSDGKQLVKKSFNETIVSKPKTLINPGRARISLTNK